MEKRMHFNEIFNINIDGTIEPKRVVRIGPVQFGPGVKIGRGVSFVGIDLFLYTKNIFLTKEEMGILIILGIYND